MYNFQYYLKLTLCIFLCVLAKYYDEVVLLFQMDRKVCDRKEIFRSQTFEIFIWQNAGYHFINIKEFYHSRQNKKRWTGRLSILKFMFLKIFIVIICYFLLIKISDFKKRIRLGKCSIEAIIRVGSISEPMSQFEVGAILGLESELLFTAKLFNALISTSE